MAAIRWLAGDKDSHASVACGFRFRYARANDKLHVVASFDLVYIAFATSTPAMPVQIDCQ
ncbi:MAG: hypothetical protein UZ21_OP11001001127 [Microgenomates bacterium OLB22]|nr:MAG: hypothetical protein UZ21_OP11001001127 [Microgenomates bacterium OLB22]